MTILVVDDEALLVKGIRFNLKSDGYDVITGSNGQEAVDLAKSENPDLIVLDVMMPVMDGLTACSRIREFSNVPIILLTAKVDDMDKLMGFDHGADDYLTKPFNILELKARIRALLRRSGAAEKQEPNKLTGGNITLDLDARNAYKGKELVVLTAKEFDVMRYLFQARGSIVSKESILSRVWGFDSDAVENNVEVYIGFLRKKLKAIGSNVTIQSIRRLGYQLEVTQGC